MNKTRLDLVNRAFDKIDRNGNGALEIDDIVGTFDPSRHPAVRYKFNSTSQVLEGRKTEEMVLGEFLETFETHHNLNPGAQNDQIVTREEWIEYYTNISASIDDDEYFTVMINNSWNLSGSASTYQEYEKGWSN